MNGAGKKAIKSALANVEDNLYRYKNFAAPDGLDGNGRPIRETVAALEKERDELKAALAEVSL